MATSGDISREQVEARVIDRRRRMEEDRKMRIFNAKQRTIGIDVQVGFSTELWVWGCGMGRHHERVLACLSGAGERGGFVCATAATPVFQGRRLLHLYVVCNNKTSPLPCWFPQSWRRTEIRIFPLPLIADVGRF